MKRRNFLKFATAGSIGLLLPAACNKKPSHILTLSFDDGFKKSFIRIAEIFETYGLKACLNVLASAHFTDFTPPDDYIQTSLAGDFELWNKLAEKGHEIMPHGWNHTNLTEVPFETASALIDKTLAFFQQNLVGFKTEEAVFNFPFNASNSGLEKYALHKVRAVRTGGNSPVNPLPAEEVKRLSCFSYGPDNADDWVNYHVANFIESTGGWLVLNLHGLDGEGWGPVSARFLNQLLQQISKLSYLEILPAGVALKKYG